MKTTSKHPVTPSFEPKSGKFMAYNHDKTIIVLDTQSWTVKKALTDEKVLCFVSFHSNSSAKSKCFHETSPHFTVKCCVHFRLIPNTVYARIQSVANILRRVAKMANFQYGTLMRIN